LSMTIIKRNFNIDLSENHTKTRQKPALPYTNKGSFLC